MTATTNDLNGVVYANGKFVAVGNGGVVEASSDGTNWVLQNSGTSSSLSAVAYGNGKFVALGANAVIASANAVAWTPAVSGLSGAAEVAGGTNGFVAVAYNQVNQVFFSSDGLNWTGQPLAQYVNAVTYANGVYLVGGENYEFGHGSFTQTYVFWSTNGSNWNAVETAEFYQVNLVVVAYNCFLVGSNYVLVALDQGIEGEGAGASIIQGSTNVTNQWTSSTYFPNPGSVSSLYPTAGAYGNGNFVFLVPSQIFSSTDAVTWTNREQPRSADRADLYL